MSDQRKPPKLSALAAGMLGTFGTPQQQLPTIQAGWATFEVLCRARNWPETVIEIARQAYFAGAGRLQDIVSSMPMDPNVVGRVHAAIEAELKEHHDDMQAMRQARENNQPPTSKP
jgi:hypothetical protein